MMERMGLRGIGTTSADVLSANATEVCTHPNMVNGECIACGYDPIHEESRVPREVENI